MTCKDCLYFNMCYVLADNPEEAEVEGAETDCSSFADRSCYVVREKGEWELVEFQSSPLDTDQALVCSCCGFAHQYDAWFNICPNCGADMRKGENG